MPKKKGEKKDILDLYFIDARHKLIDIAAFLDRVDRHPGESDFRQDAFLQAIHAMLTPGDTPRAEAVLLSFSDPTTTPIEKAPMQGAMGTVVSSQWAVSGRW